MVIRIVAFATASALMMTGCASAGSDAPRLAASAPMPYQLGPGDQVRINVYGMDAMNETYLVSDTGTISLPMIGSIPVAGKSVDAAQNDIAEALKARQLLVEPRVSAQVIAYRPVYVGGQVQRPGQYPYVPGMSVMTAVTIAGGYTFRAKKKDILITRNKVMGRAAPNSDVQAGDVIDVQESWF